MTTSRGLKVVSGLVLTTARCAASSSPLVGSTRLVSRIPKIRRSVSPPMSPHDRFASHGGVTSTHMKEGTQMNDLNHQLRQAVKNKRLSVVAVRREPTPPETGTEVASAILRWLIDPTNQDKTQMVNDAIAQQRKEK